jgi:hypothetical protein
MTAQANGLGKPKKHQALKGRPNLWRDLDTSDLTSQSFYVALSGLLFFPTQPWPLARADMDRPFGAAETHRFWPRNTRDAPLAKPSCVGNEKRQGRAPLANGLRK